MYINRAAPRMNASSTNKGILFDRDRCGFILGFLSLAAVAWYLVRACFQDSNAFIFM